MIRRLLPALLLVLAACGGIATEESAVPNSNDRPGLSTTTPTVQTLGEDSVGEPAVDEDAVSEIAERTRPLGSALLSPLPAPASQPIGLVVESLGISSAPIIDVGVESNGEMEIPGATEIGWYRFGPTPGDPGSAVLAAHIAFNGRDGVFRDLDEIEVGAIVEVAYEDGSSKRFRVTEIAQYAKDELPVGRVFAKEGTPELTLITCGGDFNRSLRSYSNNVVAVAEPIDD
ncbi:MAG: class F sortase [Acidimicrobiia bacterium]|nr:class F sortase [Acidimicrobiia bacterium]